MTLLIFAFVISRRCTAAPPQKGGYKRQGLDPKIEAVIDNFRASVPKIMDKGGVPGAAIALVDDQGILWTEGFGHTEARAESP